MQLEVHILDPAAAYSLVAADASRHSVTIGIGISAKEDVVFAIEQDLRLTDARVFPRLTPGNAANRTGDGNYVLFPEPLDKRLPVPS